VEEVGRLDLLDGRPERGRVRDVALEEVDARRLLGLDQEVEPMGVFLEVMQP
jgi:hypothetical protein